jgi:plasmid stabilization system protein ParE
MSKPLCFRPQAIHEAAQARRWYASKRREAAEGFLRELRAAYDAISAKPTVYPFYERPYRFCRLKRYPYLVFFRELDEEVEILAVAHERRLPGYWMNRVDG